jgi:hypothetical protein
MDGFNHLEHLIGKSHGHIMYVPVQDMKGNACTHIVMEAVKNRELLAHSYLEGDDKTFLGIYLENLTNGAKNRKLYGVHEEGDDPNEEQIRMSYPDVNKLVEEKGTGYKSCIYYNGVCTDLESFNSGLEMLNDKKGAFMIFRRAEATFLILGLGFNKKYKNKVLVIDSHVPTSGLLTFDNLRDYIFQNGLYMGEYLFGVGAVS